MNNKEIATFILPYVLLESQYPNLNKWGYSIGVHKAPLGYEHPWLVVLEEKTFGFWNREEARLFWKDNH